jgi:hypothetical protein
MRFKWGLPIIGLAVIAGCGGGGGGTVASGGGPIPAPSAVPVGSAKFTVDARTGQVKIEPISGSRAAFADGALSFTSSLLMSEGSPERRVLSVTARNNTQEMIGSEGYFRILFSGFQNLNTPLLDLRSTVRTTTFWGTGSDTTTFSGPPAGAGIQGPRNLDFDQYNDILYASTGSGEPLFAQFGEVNRPGFGENLADRGIAHGEGFRLFANGKQIFISIGGGSPELLVGDPLRGRTDGGFDLQGASFGEIHHISMMRSTGPNDFEAVVADQMTIRRVERNASRPDGYVTTLHTSPPGRFQGVVYRGSNFYATFVDAMIDFDSAGSSVKVISENGASVTTVGNQSASGSTDGLGPTATFGRIGQPAFVGDILFVPDMDNNKIRQLTLKPGGNPRTASDWYVSTVSGNGTASSVDGTGTAMSHSRPVSVTKGPGESLYVADANGHKIRKITPITNRFVSGNFDGSPNPVDLPQLINATDFIPSSTSRIPYIVQDGLLPAGGALNLSSWQFTLPEGLKSFSFIITVESNLEVPGVLPAVSNAGTGTRGSSLVSLRTYTGSTGPGAVDGSLDSAAYNSLQGVCSTAYGDLFVIQAGEAAIRRITRDKRVTTLLKGSGAGSVDGVWPTSSLTLPLAIACSPDGSQVFFSEEGGVVRTLELIGNDPEQPSSWRVSTIAGASSATGDVYNTTGDLARFSDVIYGIAYIDSKTIAVTDSNNHSIKTIEHRGTGITSADYFVRRLAGSGSQGYQDGTGSSAQFSLPVGIAFAQSGYLYVSDSLNRRIRRLDLGGVTTTFSGSGTSGTRDSLTPLGASFTFPYGIAVGPSGYLYVADLNGRQIRRISPAGIVTTVAGTAVTQGYADGTGASGTFRTPGYVAVGPSGDVYVTDEHRVRLLQRIITN